MKKTLQKGQMLIELLLTMGLAAIILPALLTGFVTSREGKPQELQRMQAVTLLKETEQAVKSIRNKDWTTFASLSGKGVLHPIISGTSWATASGSETINTITRQFIVSDINRNTNGAIASSGGTLDPSTKRVDITVSWSQPYAYSLFSSFYVSRTGSFTYTDTTAAQFNLGTITNTQVTNVSGGEVKLANNNKGKWCSPAFSSATIDLPDGPPVAVTATASATSINIPNDVFAVVAPNDATSTKLAYVTVSANADPPTTTLQGTFTLDASKYSPGTYPSTLGNPPSIPNLDNSFKTTDVTYYKSASGNLYALIATDLPDKEVVVVQIKNTLGNAYQDAVNKIYKYWTFFNTKMSSYVATDTGFLNPSANAADTTNAGDNNGFQTNPTKVYSNDSSFAVDTDSGSNTGTNCTGTDKDKHRFYNYNVSLPSGAAIDGIEVHLDAKVDNTTGAPKICVQLSWDGGSTWTTTQTTNTLTTNEATYTLGGSADTWGRTWNDTNFTNSNFRVRVINVASNISRDFSLDWAAVKVYYNNSTTNDYAPHGYGATSIAAIGTRGYVASGGYLYTFDLSNIDNKSTTSGLDMIGCRIELDGYDCKPGSPAVDKKYVAGETGGTWSDIGSPAHNDCSDGGNIELNATNDIYPVKVGTNNYVFVAVGAGTNPEFNIVSASSVPDSGSSPALSNSACGTSANGNASWKLVGSYDFNSNSNTEEAANSVFAKDDGTRAYITSNGGASSKQYYILNTTNKSSPTFLSGSPSSGPSSGYYNASGANGELYPRRAMTVQNGVRAVLVGKDGISNGNDAQEYQVLDNGDENTPTYCGGLNYDIGFNDLTSVSELDGDNYVYMVANTAVNELKIIQGGPDNAIFVASGTFESKPFDATSSSAFNRFVANVSLPSATSISAQVAAAPPGSSGCSNATYQYVGPNGDPATYFTAVGASISGTIPFGNYLNNVYQNPARCFRYKTWLSSADQKQSPWLEEIIWNYSP